MREITMPSSPNFVRSAFQLDRAVGAVASPFTGQTRTQEFDYAGWLAEVSLPPLKRPEATEWLSFLTKMQGPTNFFKFVDPDGRDPQKNRAATGEGIYSADYFIADPRMNATSLTLSFSGNTITSNNNAFSAVTGDFFFVSGAINDDNNGTFKIVQNASNSQTVAVTDRDLVSETSTANCSVKVNVKGATALSLEASDGTSAGLLKRGDYLALYDGASLTTATPKQLVMCTENATETVVGGGNNHFSVSIEPKLRFNFADGFYAGFKNGANESRFRLVGNSVGWDTDRNSLYTLAFSCAEVI